MSVSGKARTDYLLLIVLGCQQINVKCNWYLITDGLAVKCQEARSNRQYNKNRQSTRKSETVRQSDSMQVN
jgi:hypothetical protein